MAVAMPRCGQPVHSTGGRGMTESSSAAFSSRPARQVEAGGEEAPADPHRRELAELREPLLALDGDAGGEDLLLEVRLELLDHEQPVDGGGEAPDGLERQRVHDAELEERGARAAPLWR